MTSGRINQVAIFSFLCHASQKDNLGISLPSHEGTAAFQVVPASLSTSVLPMSTQYNNVPCTTIKILQCPFQSYPRRLSHSMNSIILLMNHITCATESPCWTVHILGLFQCQDTEKPAQNTFLSTLLSVITSHSVAIKQHPRYGNQT